MAMTDKEYEIYCEEKSEVLFHFAEFMSELLWDKESIRIWWLDSTNPQQNDESDIWMNKFKYNVSLEDINSDENSNR